FLELPFSRRLRSELDVGDIRIHITRPWRFPGLALLRILTAEGLLLAALEQRLLAFTLGGGWSRVTGHSGFQHTPGGRRPAWCPYLFCRARAAWPHDSVSPASRGVPAVGVARGAC